MLTVAILGRPNVGKSTLFNRLTGTPFALVDDTPGVTRDRREGRGNIGPLEFALFDTAGLEQAREGSLAARMSAQSVRGLSDADVALLVIDGRAGVTPEDRHFAGVVRKSGKPIIVLVNKCEGGKGKEAVAEAYSLGLGDPVPFSAAHGEGMSDLYDALVAHAQESDESGRTRQETRSAARKARRNEETEDDDMEGAVIAPEPKGPIQIAIIGRPNAGKSTLFNQLLGYERTLTGPEAGITRDAIAVDLEYREKPIKLIDTAGMRKSGNIDNKIEKMAVADSRHSIQYAHVVILVLDAEGALEKQDLTIADSVEKEGRALIIALNKWDKVENKQQYLQDFHERMEDVMPQLRGVIVQPISAERGQHVDKLLDAALATYDIWNKRIPTRKLNQWLEIALERHSPPIVNGRRIRLRYATQIKTRPPTFALFASKADKLSDSYQKYLINSLREVFDMPGIPIRIVLKKNKNPYVK